MNKIQIESSSTKRLGKIKSISFGLGGYQDCMLGLSVELGSDKESWGCGDFKGYWGPDIKVNKWTKWKEKDRSSGYAEVVRFAGKLLQDAKKSTINQLVDVPVEATFEGNTLKSRRVLTEVI